MLNSSNHLSNGKQSAIPKTATKKKAVKEIPSSENKNWLLHEQYTRREFNSCKEMIEDEINQSNGTNEFAYYIQGLIFREENKIQESLKSFRKCQKLNPKNVDNSKQVGKSLFILGQHRLSLEAYLEAETLSDRPDWEIYHYIAECLLRGASGSRNSRAEAREYLRRAVQCGRQERSYRLLADTLAQDGDTKDAITVYEAALEISPDSAALHTELGLLQMTIGSFENSFERLGTALALEPKSTRALLAVGSIMQDHQDYDVALSKYKMAAQDSPDCPELWNNIGMCFFGKQKFVAAISCLKRALWLLPLSPTTLYNLGLVHLTTQQPASAFHFLSAAINLKPDNAVSYMLLAMALKQLDDPDNALLAFERASKLTTTEATIELNFSVFLLSRDDQDGAREHLKLFYKIASGKEINRELLETALKLKDILGLDLNSLTENNKAIKEPESEVETSAIAETNPEAQNIENVEENISENDNKKNDDDLV